MFMEDVEFSKNVWSFLSKCLPIILNIFNREKVLNVS